MVKFTASPIVGLCSALSLSRFAGSTAVHPVTSPTYRAPYARALVKEPSNAFNV
jgi:hypothetical protein